MEQSATREIADCSAGREIQRIPWNAEFHGDVPEDANIEAGADLVVTVHSPMVTLLPSLTSGNSALCPQGVLPCLL